MKTKKIIFLTFLILFDLLSAQRESVMGEFRREYMSAKESIGKSIEKNISANGKEKSATEKACNPINEVKKVDDEIDKNSGWKPTKMEKQSSTVMQEVFCAIMYGDKEPKEVPRGNSKINQTVLPSLSKEKQHRFKVVSSQASPYTPPPPPLNSKDTDLEFTDNEPPQPLIINSR